MAGKGFRIANARFDRLIIARGHLVEHRRRVNGKRRFDQIVIVLRVKFVVQ
jgi:hypothetical protein